MMKTIFAFSLVFAAFLYAAPQKIERFLLVAGANNGGTDRVLLRYAESDANSFANVMSQMGGIDKNNVLRVFNPNAAAMKNGFAELEKRLQSKGAGTRKEVIVYYSGHADEKGLRLGGDVYSWADFRKNVNSLNADVKVAVLDACGSGAITRTKGGVSRPAFLQDASSEMTGYAYLTSSNENEVSQESDRLKGSFFTHALVSGLRGAADMTGDGKVTLNEAYQFAFNETLQSTQSTTGGTQHPSRDMNLAGTGDVVMTDLRETNATLVLDSNLEGRFFIRDAQGNLFAELYKTRGRHVELGMPAGKYSVQMEAPSRAWMASDIQISEGKKTNLTMNNMRQMSREIAVARGDADSAMTGLDSARAASFRVNIFGNSTEPENGLQLGLFITYAGRAFVGTQVSFFGNIAAGDMAGTQLTPLGNIAAKDFYGLQGSGLFNYATNFNGVQASVFNLAGKGKGAQAGMINVYAHDLEGMQASTINLGGRVAYGQYGIINAVGKTEIGQGGVINVAGNAGLVQGGVINVAGKADIMQGGVINVAGSVKEWQAGVINVGGHVGRQLGVINVGGHVGRQLGVINVSAKSDKTPIGLVNIVGNGIIDATFYVDETGRAGTALHLGTPYLYTLWEYSISPSFDGWSDTWPRSFGWGLGTRFGMWGNFINLDYAFIDVPDEGRSYLGLGSDNANKMHKIRLGAAYKLLPGVALSSGITLNGLARAGREDFWLEPRGEYHWHWTFGDHKVRLWPGLYAGLTVGKF
ncbi:MAG: caspase family protein [Fibromonadales bacterium]|nr:caspase family protein [Fibromonadales bacterium]